MNRLTQYLLRQSLSLTLMVTLVLTAASWLVQSLKLIEYVVDRGVGLGLFIELMLLSLPQLLELIVPIGCFIGVLFTYNKLIADSELVVMRACGSSQWALARPALLLAGAGTLLMFSLSAYFLPASKNSFKDLQFQIRNQFNSGLLQEGTFNTLGENLVVYVRERGATGSLQGLLIQDTRDPTKSATFTASSGLLTQVNGRPNVVMVNGTKEVWDNKKHQLLDPVTFDRYTLDLEQFKDTAATRVLQPDERYLPDLFNPSDVDADPIFRERLVAEGHYRLVEPFYCLAYVAIALAALLTGELNRRGQTKRLLSALGLMVVLQTADLAVRNLTDRNLSAAPLMYLTAILPICVALVLVLYGHELRARLRTFQLQASGA
jgi:lipopolysaccharide export system permease protein